MTQPTYGGQAVIEGVMIRGVTAVAVAVRTPDGDIATRASRVGGSVTGRLRQVPFLRGIVVLWETLSLGIGALTWSAAVAAEEIDEDGEPRPIGLIGWASLAATLLVAGSIFFAGPVAATSWMDAATGFPSISVLAEGVLRIALLLGYIWLIGRSSDIQRVFQYHGAEHMTIFAFEHGRELSVPAIRRFAKEHPRCGTSFLLTVALVAVIAFMLVPAEPLWWRFSSRLLLVPLIAALAYEVIRFAGTHQASPVIRWLFRGNIALQYLTTRVPDDEQIQVAIAALDRVLVEEGAAARVRAPLVTEAETPPIT